MFYDRQRLGCSRDIQYIPRRFLNTEGNWAHLTAKQEKKVTAKSMNLGLLEMLRRSVKCNFTSSIYKISGRAKQRAALRRLVKEGAQKEGG